jgi:hypothetical protein
MKTSLILFLCFLSSSVFSKSNLKLFQAPSNSGISNLFGSCDKACNIQAANGKYICRKSADVGVELLTTNTSDYCRWNLRKVGANNHRLLSYLGDELMIVDETLTNIGMHTVIRLLQKGDSNSNVYNIRFADHQMHLEVTDSGVVQGSALVTTATTHDFKLLVHKGTESVISSSNSCAVSVFIYDNAKKQTLYEASGLLELKLQDAVATNKFTVTPNENGYFTLKSNNSNKFISLSGDKVALGDQASATKLKIVKSSDNTHVTIQNFDVENKFFCGSGANATFKVKASAEDDCKWKIGA